MEWLVAIVLVIAGGYYWVAGGWYARIVATVLFVPLGAFCGAALLSLIATPTLLTLAIGVGAVSGAAGGWYFAGWPAYYQRRYGPMGADSGLG